MLNLFKFVIYKSKGVRLLYMTTLCLSVFSLFVELIFPKLLSLFIDEVLVSRDLTLFNYYLKLFIIFFLFSILTIYISETLSPRINLKIKLRVINSILDSFKIIDPTYIDRYDKSYLSKRINSDSDYVVAFVLRTFNCFFTKGLYLIGGVYYIYSFGVLWVFYLVAISSTYIVAYRILKPRLLVLSKEILETDNLFFSALSHNVTDYKSLKLHEIDHKYRELLTTSNQNYLDKCISNVKVRFFFSNSSAIISYIVMVLLVLFGTTLIFDNKLTVGGFIALSTYFSIATNALSYFLSFGNDYLNVKASFDRILEFLDKKNLVLHSSQLHVINQIDNISIKELNFKLSDQVIFNNFNLELKKGHIYKFIGPNGCGKTTLVSLLTGIYPRNDIQIFYNKIPFYSIDFKYIRKNCFSVMEQTPLIFPGSIKDNLTLFSNFENFDLCLLDKYTEKLFSNKFMSKNFLLDQVDTLSGGEKQKISFLRTVSKLTSVMIFDEPTNSLDIDSVKKIENIINEISKNRIIIIISHDPSFAEEICKDKIYF